MLSRNGRVAQQKTKAFSPALRRHAHLGRFDGLAIYPHPRAGSHWLLVKQCDQDVAALVEDVPLCLPQCHCVGLSDCEPACDPLLVEKLEALLIARLVIDYPDIVAHVCGGTFLVALRRDRYGETLPSFMLECLQDSITRRRDQRQFIERGLKKVRARSRG